MSRSLVFWPALHLQPAGVGFIGLGLALVLLVPDTQVSRPWDSYSPGVPLALLAPAIAAIGATGCLSTDVTWLERQAVRSAVAPRLVWAAAVLAMTALLLILAAPAARVTLRNFLIASVLALVSLMLLGSDLHWLLPGAYFLSAMLFGAAEGEQIHPWAVVITTSATDLELVTSAAVVCAVVVCWAPLIRQLPLARWV